MGLTDPDGPVPFTGPGRIDIPNACFDLFQWDNVDTVLEEYYHVIFQWGQGSNLYNFIWASFQGWRNGGEYNGDSYRNSQMEIAAKKFTKMYRSRFKECLRCPLGKASLGG